MLSNDSKIECRVHRRFHRVDELCPWCDPLVKPRRRSQLPENWGPAMFDDINHLSVDELDDLMLAYCDPDRNPRYVESFWADKWDCSILIERKDGPGFAVFEYGMAETLWAARRELAQHVFDYHEVRKV